MTNFTEMLKDIPIQDNSIVLMLDSEWTENSVRDLAKALKIAKYKRVTIALVRSFDSLKVMPESEMKRAGWVRIETTTLYYKLAQVFQWIARRFNAHHD